MPGNRIRRWAVIASALLATTIGIGADATAAPAAVLKPCPAGFVCVTIGAHEYRFSRFGSYPVHWTGPGTLVDNLTNGGVVRLASLSGPANRCIPPGRTLVVNWTPVQRMILAPGPC